MAQKLLAKTEQSLINEMQVRAEFFARSSREAIFPKVDLFSLHFHVKELLKEKAVVYAMVIDDKGRVLSHSEPRFIGETLRDPASAAAGIAEQSLLQRRLGPSGEAAYDFSAPIRAGHRRLGTAMIGFNQSSIDEALRGPKREILAVVAASMAVTILGTVFIVGWISRPLLTLAAAAREVEKGNFKVQVDWKSRDEIGILARAFNDMTSANAAMFDAVRNEKEKLGSVFNRTREGMIWAGIDGRILLINPAARSLLGWDEAKTDLAAAVADFSISPPLAGILSGLSEAVAIELQRERPKRLILSGIAERLGGLREFPGILFIFHDATIEKREEVLGRGFLSLVSHKLRTPLAIALGHLELILQEPKSLNVAQRRALGTIYAENNRLRRLVETLITFSTVQSPETIQLDCGEASLLEIIRGALKSLPELTGQEGVVILWDREAVSKLPAIFGDASLLKEVIKNLVENAIKFNRAPRKEARIAVQLSGREIRVSVADNGPGIPSEEHSKLFKKFYQVDDDYTGQVPGMGLGLAFIKSVIEAHGGATGLRSSPGRGSEFFFTLILPAA